MNTATLDRARREIAEHLAEIADLLAPGMRLTLLARQPSHPDGSRDLVVTDDGLTDVVDALRTFQASNR